MKLVVIGGSAHSTPSLFASGPLRDALENIDVVLLGRSRERLDAVARAIRVIARSTSVRLSCASIDSGGGVPALRGADVVLCQARYGGYEARVSDETFPLKYGLCGDEGLGVGGLAAAWRSWPPLHAALESVRRECPQARVILMTSPVGVLTRCALAAFPDLNLAGICELPWTTLQDACAAVGVNGLDASFTYAGVNHLGWIWGISSGKRDIVAEFGSSREGLATFPSGELIGRLRAIPLKYLRMHYEAQSALLEQTDAARSRGAELIDLQQRAYSAYQSGDYHSIAALLPRRPTPWYEFAVSPLIAGFAGMPVSIPFFLTARNDRYAVDFDPDDVLEIPHRFAEGRLKPVGATGRIPDRMRAALEAFVAYERVASEAVSKRDAVGIQHAVSVHPWVSDARIAPRVAEEICC
jgi:6-phospho-beta-glucosidase